MRSLKFYILIESKEKESEVRIDGSLETLRELFHTLCAELANPVPIISSPAEEHKHEQGGDNATQ
ncbi:MAG TPA: hypothetical protein DCX54_00335 [Flavobacteriales bacterium]|nr:hypothetical protein [Flavobacteriales bacterium]